MDFKDSAALRTSLITSYSKTIDIDVSTEGSPERDIFVEAPIEGQLLDIWSALEYLYKLQAPFIYTDQLLTEDIDVYCRNNDVGTIPATYSTGSLTFFAYNKPSADITIDSSFGGKTADGSKSFYVSGFYTIPVQDVDSYYNATTNRYELTTTVIANTPGPDGSTGTSTVTELTESIQGIDGCINNSAITGGEAEGTLTDRLNLVKRKFQGRSLNTTEGIKLFVEAYSRFVTVVGSNDPLMVRSDGLGGSIDIYIRDSTLEGTRDTVVITSTGLSSILLNPAYTSTGITLLSQPVDSIVLTTIDGTVIDRDYYTLTKDTGILTKSTRSYDALELTSTGLAQIGPFIAGQTVEIRYNYNKLLHDIEDQLNDTVNLYDNRDYLLREQQQVTINIYLQIKLYAGYTIDGITTSASLAIATYMESFETGYVELADIVTLVKNLGGVDNVNLETALLTPTDGRAKTASGDVPIGNNEYPVEGTLDFVEWTY
jgi:hypothetical protein